MPCAALVGDGGDGDGGDGGDGGGVGGGDDDGANRSALLAPVVALSAAAFGASLLLERRAGYELRGCLLPLEPRALNQVRVRVRVRLTLTLTLTLI